MYGLASRSALNQISVAIDYSQSGSDLFVPATKEAFSNVINQTIQQQYTARSREQIARFFAGMELVAPGLVPVEEWRPDSAMANAVSRKLAQPTAQP